MSISIISQPIGSIQSSNNDSFFIISGSSGITSSVFDFKYIADVYVNNVKVTTLKAFPDPNFGYGVFNLRNLTPNFVLYDFIYTLSQDTGSIFHLAGNSSANVQLFYGKEYSFFGGFSQSRGEASSSIYNYINSALSFTDAITSNLASSYLISDGIQNTNFLTKAAFSIPTFSSLRNFLYAYVSSSVANYLSISTFDVHSNKLGQYSVQNPYSSSGQMEIVATGLPQLSLLTSGSALNQYQVQSGNPVMLNSQVSTYSVQLSSSTFVTNPVSYTILTDCSKFSPYSYKLYWLNSLGGFDSFIFNKVNLTTLSKNQTNYKKIPGTLNANGTYSVNTYSPSIVPFYTETVSGIQVSSDFLIDKEVLYLKGLYQSPVIFLEDTNNLIISVTHDPGNKHTLNRKGINNKTYSAQFNFIPSNSDFSQAQ
jgi:hypothetical protein